MLRVFHWLVIHRQSLCNSHLLLYACSSTTLVSFAFLSATWSYKERFGDQSVCVTIYNNWIWFYVITFIHFNCGIPILGEFAETLQHFFFKTLLKSPKLYKWNIRFTNSRAVRLQMVYFHRSLYNGVYTVGLKWLRMGCHCKQDNRIKDHSKKWGLKMASTILPLFGTCVIMRIIG